MKKSSIKSFLGKLMVLVCSLTMFISASTLDAQAATATLANTYGQTYGKSGTCINLNQLKDSRTLSIVKNDFNSITLENEMKPDAMLGYNNPRLISVSQAKSQGYYIPDNYKEQYVPQINFSTVDQTMKICYQNGIKMRAHTLVWHSQTPDWFFKSNYSGNSGYVNEQTMDARLEMYVKTVMNHVYSSQYGSVVYAWDVANEILHAQNSGWEKVYRNYSRTNAPYVKKAFNYAYDCLEYYKLTDSVKLFYNDFNTYDEVNEVKSLVNYINQGRKVCAGVGMQSHITTRYTSVDKYMNALNSFLNAGFEVQITELDIVANNDNDFNNYAYQLFKRINSTKKNGGKITSITWWGLSDQNTWITGQRPLLFSTPGNPKPAYNKVIQAYTETIGQPGNQTQPIDNPGAGTSTGTENKNSTATISNGWYYLKNTNSQKYLTVEGNKGKDATNVYISKGTGAEGQKWYVENKGDGYITLKSGLGNFNLDVANGVDEDGANIQIYTAYGHDAQQFIVKNTKTKGVYTIGTKSSNATKYIDVYKHEKTDGTNVCQWSFGGNPNQEWIFEPVGNSGQPKEENPGQGQQEQTQPTPEPEKPTDSALTASYTINNWGSGYQVSIKVDNKSGNTVNNWSLKLKKSEVKITSAWNMNYKIDGDYYVITPVDWNKTVANGQSVDIGFMGEGNIGNSLSVEVQAK